MRKNLLIFLLVFFFALPVFAQQVDTAWVRRYHGPEAYANEPHAISLDDSGNILVTGYDADYATIKYYPNGDTAWVRRWCPPEDRGDVAFAIATDHYGNVYVTGGSYSEWAYWDYVTIKYDSIGNELWVRQYGSEYHASDVASAIGVDASGNVYVTGYSRTLLYDDYVTIKYDSTGNQLWVSAYNGISYPYVLYDYPHALAVDGESNVYVTGVSGTGSLADYATVKYNTGGAQVWARRYNGPGNSYDDASAIALDDSGNIFITGYSYGGSATKSDYATIKYDHDGNELWVRRYDGPAGLDDGSRDIAVDGSGNIYVTGYSTGIGTAADYATIKYNPDGNQLWVRRYNGLGNSADSASAVATDRSGSVYVTGRSGSGYATVKYDPNGNELWVRRYNGLGDSTNYATAIAVDNCLSVYVTGVSGSGTLSEYATIKYWQNYSPNLFSLIAPTDSAVQLYAQNSAFTISFDWETSIDPDPCDTVRYDLYISTSSTFHSDSTVVYYGLSTKEHTDTVTIGRYYWKVRAYDNHTGTTWSAQTWTFLSAIRGDANADKKVTVADVVYLVNFLFKNGPAPYPFQVGDVNCDRYVTVSDVVYLINYLFKGGPPPAC